MKRVTITDVAKLADVSISTVSRVLNKNYPVSSGLRDRVMDAVSKLQYQPNAVARSLKQKRTYLIGIIVADISNPFFMEIGKGIESMVESKGYNLIFCSSDENPKKELTLLKLLYEKRVDAIILAPCKTESFYISHLLEQGFPIVLIDRKIQGCSAEVVAEDNFSASYEIVRHLIKNGHREIAIVNGPLNVSSGKERFEGYKAALKKSNIQLTDKYVLNGNFQRSEAYAVTKKMIYGNPDDLPTAIFSANNLMTEGVMAALFENGMVIPDDVSLVSFGNIRAAGIVQPKLTLVSQNSYAMGLKAGEIALAKIGKETADTGTKQYIMVPELIYGDSVRTL